MPKATRYVVRATFEDGFDVLVCDRGKTFTKGKAQDLIDDPIIREIYEGARLYMTDAQGEEWCNPRLI